MGIGPGSPGLRTSVAEDTIKSADFVVGYRPYLELIQDLLPGKKVVLGSMGRELDRVKAAVDLLQEGSVALVSSGDPNVYGMAGLGLELAPDPSSVEIVPGVTSFTAAACSAGVAFRDCVAVISLSDLLTPWGEIEGRLRMAAERAMPVALYNPRSKRRDWQLPSALDILGNRDVLVAKNVGRENQEIFWTTSVKLIEDDSLRERIDMTTLIILSGKGIFRGEVSSGARVNVVGIGPGDRRYVTSEAKSILLNSTKIFGAGRYLHLVGDLSSGEKVSHTGPCPERMAARFLEAKNVALKGEKASVLTGGDPSVFSSGWRIVDQARGVIPVHISPGVSAFSSVAAKAGAPLVNDFVLRSEPGDPSEISSLAQAGFGIVIYNAKGHEISQILQDVDPDRPCAMARDVAREREEIMILTADDLQCARPSGFRFTLLIASANSFIKNERIITRRGYENKYSY